MVLVSVCVGLLLVAGLLENYFHQRNLKKIPIRILVNGTRGKTSVCRLVVAALNKHGIRTMGRTTGSEAAMLNPDGSVEPFVRRTAARITEMIPFVRSCAKAEVRCMVVECMALGAENQRTIARTLVKPTHVVITNSYVDHIVEIGSTTEETAWTLSQSVPKGCELFAVEDCYQGLDCIFHKVDVAQQRIAVLMDDRIERSPIPLHGSNVSLSVALCGALGVGEDEVLAAISEVVPDIGLHRAFTGRNGAVFHPDFSVNDLHCMEEAVLAFSSKTKKLSLVYNNRADREYRLPLMLQILKRYGGLVSCVYCIGDYPKKVASYFSKRGGVAAAVSSEKELYESINQVDGDNVFLGLGNIKGAGERLVRLFMAKGEV